MTDKQGKNENPVEGSSLEGQRHVSLEHAGRRLDQVLVALYPELSRSRLQALLKQGNLVIADGDGQSIDAVASMRVRGGECIEIENIPVDPNSQEVLPQAIELNIIHADEHLVVINKPADLVMHPAAGNPDGTVQNALLHFDPELARIPRAGIVHRLDKDTTGIFVVARSLQAHASLVSQLQQRIMGREYVAVVLGDMHSGGSVDQPIGRHPRDRLRMAVVASGKPAVTHYSVDRSYSGAASLSVRLESGRTHQIRVHMSWLKHPLVGDPLYGGKNRIPGGLGDAVRSLVASFPRQALHAHRLSLIHPESGQQMQWLAEIPDDIVQLQKALEQGTGKN